VEGIQTADGTALELERAAEIEQTFARAMASGTPADVPPPPKRDQNADDVQADKPKRGRPRNDARTTTSAKPAGKPAKPGKTPPPVKDDYTEDATGLVQATWTVAASLPPTQAFAYVLAANADGLAAGLAEGAKHSTTIRTVVAGTGGNTWMLQLGATGLNMAMQTMAILRDPDMRKQAAEATRVQLREAMQAHGIAMPAEPAPDAQAS
jgi:hypothetical protein